MTVRSNPSRHSLPCSTRPPPLSTPRLLTSNQRTTCHHATHAASGERWGPIWISANFKMAIKSSQTWIDIHSLNLENSGVSLALYHEKWYAGNYAPQVVYISYLSQFYRWALINLYSVLGKLFYWFVIHAHLGIDNGLSCWWLPNCLQPEYVSETWAGCIPYICMQKSVPF